MKPAALICVLTVALIWSSNRMGGGYDQLRPFSSDGEYSLGVEGPTTASTVKAKLSGDEKKAAKTERRNAKRKAQKEAAAAQKEEAARLEAERLANLPVADNPDIVTGPVQAYVYTQAVNNYGWDGDEWTALVQLLTNESGWDPQADNPTSSAWGLFQFMGFVAKERGMNHPSHNGVRPELEEQVRHGLDYIHGRYGSPVKALQHWNARVPIGGKDVGHWY